VKLLYVLSTALFILQPVQVTRDVPFSSTDRFTGDYYNIASVDDTPALSWAGNLFFGVGYPVGMTYKYAVQSFNTAVPIDGNAALCFLN
jgi:hypothetical protein